MDDQEAGLRLAELQQAALQTSAGDKMSISPASLQVTRAVALEADSFFFADGARAYCAHVPLPPADAPRGAPKKMSLVTAPLQLQPAACTDLPGLQLHPGSEIQSVDAVRTASASEVSWIAAVADSRGRACVGRLLRHSSSSGSSSSSSGSGRAARFSVDSSSVYTVSLPGVLESGWCGVSVCDAPPHAVALAHSFSRIVAVTAGTPAPGTAAAPILATWYTQHTPTAVRHLPSGSAAAGCVAVAEGPAVAVFDPRQPKRCVWRDIPGSSYHTLYAMDADGHSLAAAGSESTVFVYDLRKWRSGSAASASGGAFVAAGIAAGGASKVMIPAKYHITGLQIDDASQLCYVTGSDQEVLCSSWSKGAGSGAVEGDGTGTSGGAGGGSGGGGRKQQRRTGGGAGEGRQLHYGGFTGQQAKRMKLDPEAAPAAAPPIPEAEGEAEGGAEKPTTKGPPGRLALSYHTGFRGNSRWIGLSLLRGDCSRSSSASSRVSESERGSGSGSGVSDRSHVLMSISETAAFVVTHADRMNMLQHM